MRKQSEETKQKISNSLKGQKLSNERIMKISKTVKQHWDNGVYENVDFSKSLETREKLSKSLKALNGKYVKKENESPNWVGENVSYPALHTWLSKKYGKSSKCEMQDESCKGNFEWSNISGEYKRDVGDFQQLCRSHHNRYDNKPVFNNKEGASL